MATSTKLQIGYTLRYLKLLGTKSDIKEMMTDLKMSIKPYPKGNNKRYDATYKPTVQGVLI